MSWSSKRISHVRGRAALVVLMFIVPLAVSMAGAYVNHPDYKTGAPGERTCQDCHNTYGLNTGDGYVMVSGISDTYLPGKTYLLTVIVYSPGMMRYCFELTAVAKDATHPSGSFSCINTTTTCSVAGGKYIKTTKMGCMDYTDGMSTWEVSWNSPSKAESDITFYCVGMGSNGDNDEEDDCVYTCQMMVCPAPSTPTQPKGIVVEPGDGMVALSWYMATEPDPKGGPVTYNVYWSDSMSGGLSLLSTVTEREYVHTGLVNCRTYRYQISASNNEGEGPLSSVVTATPDLVPDAPRHLGTVCVESDNVQLSWDEPSNWGSASGHAYVIYRGTSPWDVTVLVPRNEAASYTDMLSLEPNTTYYYRVQSRNDLGVGGVEQITIHVPPATPSFPIDLSLQVSLGVVDLTWQPPADDGGDCVRFYRVYRAEEGKSPVLIKDSLTATGFTDTSALADIDYEYTVTAVNVAGEGSLSTPVEACIAPPPSTGDDGQVVYSQELPFSGLVIVGAVIIIGALIVGRLSSTANRAERAGKD